MFLFHSITVEMQFNIHLVMFALGYLDTWNWALFQTKWEILSDILSFDICNSGKPAAFDHNHAERTDLDTDYPTSVSPALNSSDVGRLDL